MYYQGWQERYPAQQLLPTCPRAAGGSPVPARLEPGWGRTPPAPSAGSEPASGEAVRGLFCCQRTTRLCEQTKQVRRVYPPRQIMYLIPWMLIKLSIHIGIKAFDGERPGRNSKRLTAKFKKSLLKAYHQTLHKKGSNPKGDRWCLPTCLCARINLVPLTGGQSPSTGPLGMQQSLESLPSPAAMILHHSRTQHINFSWWQVVV